MAWRQRLKSEIKLILQKIIPEENLKFDEPMKNHTTLHIGGNAFCLALPQTIEEIKQIIQVAKRYDVSFFVIGNGSNLLVSDEGFDGIIIKLMSNFSEITFLSENEVTAKAGTMLSKLSSEIAKRSLTGFEFAGGIPGTLGGAVTMNAGAYGGEIKQCIKKATVLTKEGKVLSLSREELQLSYRKSIIEEKGYILLDATFEFSAGDEQLIRGKMTEYAEARRDKQPLDKWSAGSTFKRPEGYFAGKLIMDAGLRGYRVGDAQVSEKHCGFVVNLGQATAKEFYQVIKDVQKIVYETYHVMLEPEVKLLGTFDVRTNIE